MGLRLKEYKTEIDDLASGDTMRVNHINCTAGTDTRRRLYLTRPHSDPEVVVGYCHNCQEGGHWNTGTHEVYREFTHKAKASLFSQQVTDKLVVPSHLIPRLVDWPVGAQAWAMQNKLDQQRLTRWGIQYDPSSDRAYIPRNHYRSFSTVGTLVGYQLRNCDPRKNVPKYTTVVTDADKGFTVLNEQSLTVHPTCVIVEDYISGLRIVEAGVVCETPFVAIVNYGTKVNLEACHYAAQFPTVIVWLDNDSKHVMDQAKQMQRTVIMINPQMKRSVITEQSDPKHYALEDIAASLNRNELNG